MIQKNEVLLKSNDEWLHFANPQKVVLAEQIDEMRGALGRWSGWHAAGFVSYEAASAFDSALYVLSADDWFGLYPEPKVMKTSEVIKDLRGFAAQNWRPSIKRESYNTAIEKVKVSCITQFIIRLSQEGYSPKFRIDSG